MKHVPHTRPGDATAVEKQLAEHVDLLASYMKRHRDSGYDELVWASFAHDYPRQACEIDEWLTLWNEM